MENIKLVVTYLITRPAALFVLALTVAAGTLLYVQPPAVKQYLPTSWHRAPAPVRFGDMRVVTYDPLWLTNSQVKAMAEMQFGRPGGKTDTLSSAEISAALMQTSKRVKKVLEEVAGPGTVVLVRQGVAIGRGIPDITEEVLIRLELPVDVPHEPVETYDGRAFTGVSDADLERSDQAAAQFNARIRQKADEMENGAHNSFLP